MFDKPTYEELEQWVMELEKEAAMRGKDEKELENLNIQMSGMLESISDGFYH